MGTGLERRTVANMSAYVTKQTEILAYRKLVSKTTVFSVFWPIEHRKRTA